MLAPGPAVLAKPLGDPAQAMDIQQRRRFPGRRVCAGAREVRQAHGHRRVRAVGQSHDQVRIGSPADADHFNALLEQRVMGMEDGGPPALRVRKVGSVRRVS